MFYHGISQVEAIRKNKADSTILTLVETLFRYIPIHKDWRYGNQRLTKILCIFKTNLFSVMQICKQYLYEKAKEV